MISSIIPSTVTLLVIVILTMTFLMAAYINGDSEEPMTMLILVAMASPFVIWLATMVTR